jgi:hypothetical protein
MMAGNTQSAGGNAAAYVQEQERQQQFIKNIADLPETEAKAAIHKQAHNEVGQYGKDVVAVREAHIKEDLAKYKEITPFDKVAGVFAQNSVTSTTAFNKDGFAGHTAKVQQQIPLPSEAGAIWGNVSVNQDAKGNVTGGAVGVNHVGIPFTVGGVDVVKVANVTANVPKDGKFGAENVSILVGGIAKEHGNKDATNYTAAVITNGKFDDLSVYGRASKPLYRENGLEVTGYGEAIYNVPNEQLGVNAGVRADKDVGGGNSVYVQAAVNTFNVTNKAEVTGNITAGFVWGGAEQKSEIEQRLAQVNTVQQTQTEKGALQHTGNPEKAAEYKAVAAESNAKPNITTASAGDHMHSTIAPHAGEAQDPVQAKLEHFYELPRNEQRAIVSHMTDIYVKHNPGVGHEEAQSKVLHEILNPQRNQEPEYSHG